MKKNNCYKGNRAIILSVLMFSILAFLPFVDGFFGTIGQNKCVLIQTILNSSWVNISTINYPNSSIALQNVNMTKLGNSFTYNFCDTSTIGIYTYTYFDNFGDGYVNDFEITKDGIPINQIKGDSSLSGIYIIFILGIVLFVGFLFIEKFIFKWSFFLLSIFFIVVGINILSIYMQNIYVNDGIREIFDQIGAVSYLIYYFIAGLLLFLWIFSVISTMVDNYHINQARKIGEGI